MGSSNGCVSRVADPLKPMGFPTAVTATEAKVGPEQNVQQGWRWPKRGGDHQERFHGDSKMRPFFPRWKIGVGFFVLFVRHDFPQWKFEWVGLDYFFRMIFFRPQSRSWPKQRLLAHLLHGSNDETLLSWHPSPLKSSRKLLRINIRQTCPI